ncbi:MAG: protein kinase, partial [Actinomycetaceae bacterium UMB1218B]|nr:protein kinase [Actinomycetaceae bacterium UMB1218B]
MTMHSDRLGTIAFMTSNGPLWEVTRDNEALLISVYSSDIARDQMQRWIAWRGLVHPNVAELVEISSQPDGRVSLSQRRYAGRTLQALLDSGQQLNDNQRRRIVADVRAGVCALHDRGIIHTDIAPSNIVVSSDFHATLIDIAIPAQAGEGTPGFSLSATKDQRSDDAGVEAIACALNIDPLGLNPTRVEQRPLQQTVDSRCDNPSQMNDVVTWRKEHLLDKHPRGLPATQGRRRGALAGIIIVLLSVIYGMTRPPTLSNASFSTGGIKAQSVPSSGGIER